MRCAAGENPPPLLKLDNAMPRTASWKKMPERRSDGNVDRRFGDAVLLNLEVSNAILRLLSERSGACRGREPNRIARIVSDHTAGAKGESERVSVNACDRDIDGPFDEATHKLVQPFLAPQRSVVRGHERSSAQKRGRHAT
jgi:hypothetical protein